MVKDPEATTIGLSEQAHRKLQRLKEDGHFLEMQDGYRFAISLALAHGGIAPPITGKKKTTFNIGTLDRDGSIAAAIRALQPRGAESVYRAAERLAEWGVEELDRLLNDENASLTGLLRNAEGLLERREGEE